MKIERIRSILGVWAPIAIGLFIIVTSISFYFNATLSSGIYKGNLESWRLVCSAGAFFVGGLLLLSTYGRYRKTKEARREGTGARPSLPASAPAPHEDRDDNGNRDHDED